MEFVDFEKQIAEQLANGELNGLVESDNFGYVPMRFTGTGITERKDSQGNEIELDRDLKTFSSDELMKKYANLPITFTHPQNENGEYVELGFDNSDLIIGNTIHSYIKDDEIWVIGKIFNKTALDYMKTKDLSTSPYVLSLNVKQKGEANKKDNLMEEPLHIDHLAIVDVGFWDNYTQKAPIENDTIYLLKEETQMAEEQNPKVDSLAVETNSIVDSGENDLVEVKTNTLPTKQESLEQKVADLENHEAEEAEQFKELAENHEELKGEEMAEDIKEKEEVKEEETKKVDSEVAEEKKEEATEEKVEETKKADAEETIEEKKEEVIDDNGNDRKAEIIEETMKNQAMQELLDKASWCSDDDKREEYIKDIVALADSAKANGVEINKPFFGKERYRPEVVLKKFFKANQNLISKEYQNISSKIDSADLKIGEMILNDMKQNVMKNKKVVETPKKGLVDGANGVKHFFM